MTTPIIQSSSISKHFGSAMVLDQLDWQVMPGQVIGLLGRNGAGKSTLLECLLGLRETDSGSVRIYGEDVARLSDATRARIGYVPQKSDLFEWMTPRQMLGYFQALYPRWNAAKVDALLERWGFDALMQEKPISKLSGGEQQRLSIIRALAHDPELLVLDEPPRAAQRPGAGGGGGAGLEPGPGRPARLPARADRRRDRARHHGGVLDPHPVGPGARRARSRLPARRQDRVAGPARRVARRRAPRRRPGGAARR